MSALELITLLSQAVFVLLAVLVSVPAVRRPTRVRVDTALFFVAFATVVLVGRITELLGVTLSEAASDASVAVVVALPFLLLRLAADFGPVPVRSVRAAAVGLAVSVAAVILAPQPLPGAISLGVIAYFVLVAGYAALLFVRQAIPARDVMRRRLQFIGLGTALLTSALLLAGVGILASGAQPLTAALTQLVVLGSALSWSVGFAPPDALRRYWREPLLRQYLRRASDLASATTVDAIKELESITSAATSAHAAIGLLEPDGALVYHTVPAIPGQDGPPLRRRPDQTLSGLVLEARQARYFTNPAASAPALADELRARGVKAAAGAPILSGTDLLGVLMISIEQRPAFVEDDLELLELLATQAGITIQTRRLLERQESLLAAAHTAQQTAERATEAKTEFLAGMSHELRTPLNAILGFSELLREQLGETMSQGQRRYLTNIHAAGEHLLALINDILDLSKVEAGRVDLRPELTTLDELAAPVAASTRSTADAAKVVFVAETGGQATAFVDVGRVRQVLYNLTSNAVKFTPAGGRVELRLWLEGNDLRVEVSDTGIGIPADRQDRVFGHFERVNEDRSEAVGTGLGLALTKRLVELHGGTIDFASAEGAGTTFRVCVPNVAAARFTKGRLLVVEDERRDAELIVALAAEHGLRSEVVPNATAAVASIERESPLAVVLDLRLPDARGETVLRALKRQPTHVRIAVVTVEDDDGHSVRLGADVHLVKPIDRARLAAWLERVTAGRESRDARLAG